jgi:hypothetical protein
MGFLRVFEPFMKFSVETRYSALKCDANLACDRVTKLQRTLSAPRKNEQSALLRSSTSSWWASGSLRRAEPGGAGGGKMELPGEACGGK